MPVPFQNSLVPYNRWLIELSIKIIKPSTTLPIHIYLLSKDILSFTAYSGLVKKEVVDLKEGIPLKVQGADRAICLA